MLQLVVEIKAVANQPVPVLFLFYPPGISRHLPSTSLKTSGYVSIFTFQHYTAIGFGGAWKRACIDAFVLCATVKTRFPPNPPCLKPLCIYKPGRGNGNGPLTRLAPFIPRPTKALQSAADH